MKRNNANIIIDIILLSTCGRNRPFKTSPQSVISAVMLIGSMVLIGLIGVCKLGISSNVVDYAANAPTFEPISRNTTMFCTFENMPHLHSGCL